jgi:HPt (histidine-containing phosphotransfer) domain-containing protein
MTHAALMLDAAYPPTVGWKAPSREIEVFAGYLGGGGALHTWSPADMKRMLEQVGGFVGIWVPAQEPLAYSWEMGIEYAHQALQSAEAASLPNNVVICLDIETSMASANLPGCRECAAAWTETLQGTLGRPAGLYAPVSVFQGWPQVPTLAWTPEPGTADLTNPTQTIAAGVASIARLGLTQLAPVQAVQVGFDMIVGGANVDVSVIQWTTAPAAAPPVRTDSTESDLAKLAQALQAAKAEGAAEATAAIKAKLEAFAASL